MAEEERKKGKSKFGMMVDNMGRSAKKGMKRASKQMAKGAVKAKQTAATKIAKVPTTDEDPEIISALQRLKVTKTEMYANSDIARNLYEARLNAAIFLIQLGDKLKSAKSFTTDPFTSYLQEMGACISSTELVQSNYLKCMQSELVIPLETFATIDVEKAQKLKLKYKNGKTQFDIAAHKLTKAQESQDQTKIQEAQQKKDAAFTQLTNLRNDMKLEINNLEQKKQTVLLGNMDKYFTSYATFASEQSDLLSKHIIEKENYFINIDDSDQDEIKNEVYEDEHVDLVVLDENDNDYVYQQNDENDIVNQQDDNDNDDYNPLDE